MMDVKKKLSLIALKYFGRKPLVLNLEISHACNLKCKYCGRLEEDVKGKLDYEKAVKAIDEVDSPIIYFTGGEPFLFAEDLKRLVKYSLDKSKVVIIVTNGTLLAERLEKFDVDKKNLVLMLSVDGLKESNDKIRGEGSFEKMEEGLKIAKDLGYNVWLNFTVFSSNADELKSLVEYFKDKVDYFHLNMFFDFKGDAKEVEAEKVADVAIQLKKKYKNILNPILYFKMWKGLSIDCTPFGTVTLDPKGWRSPCYFICKKYFSTYNELMKKTDWERFVKREDGKCKNCKAHCGFEPTIYRKKSLLLKEILKRV